MAIAMLTTHSAAIRDGLARNPDKFDALSRTGRWAPHTSNKPGSQRAVYDPVSHKATLYTFDNSGGVSWIEGQGDKLMREKQQAEAQQATVVSKVQTLLKKELASTPVDRAARGSGYEHVVESGHTLSAIAVAYGSTVKAIQEANQLSSDNIYIGQKLFIPE